MGNLQDFLSTEELEALQRPAARLPLWKPTCRDDRYRPTRENIIKSAQDIFSQDVPIVEAVQQRAGSRDELDIRPHFSPF